MTLWDLLADKLDPPPQPDYVSDPARWVTDKLDSFLWSKQREILESVRDHHDTAVPSCHNAGKSFDAAACVCWWLDAHRPGEAFVVTSAPTGDQVKGILWREIGRQHKKGTLPGHTNLTEWYIDGELVALGRKPNDYEPTAFQGYHAIYLLVVLDEACGIPPQLWEAASTLTSNDTGRILAIGNPDDPNSEFARVCAPGSGWNVIPISALDTPNWTGEPVPSVVSRSLISKAWAESKAIQWGQDSALYTSKVLGRFPVDTENGVVPNSMVQPCRHLGLEPVGPVEGGLDCGGSETGDHTVLRERRGPVAGRVKHWQTGEPMALVGQIVEIINDWGLERIKVDSIGVGWGVAGRLAELSSVNNPAGEGTHQAEIVRVNVSEASHDPKRFANKRAEIWWEVGRENSRRQLWDLEACDDDCIAELTNPTYEIVDSNGKIKIEKKDEIRKRLGRSPDDADALLLAFYRGVGAVTSVVQPILTARIPGVDRR